MQPRLMADTLRCSVLPTGKAARLLPLESAPVITALPEATRGMLSRNDSSAATLVSPTRVLTLAPTVRMFSAYTIT